MGKDKTEIFMQSYNLHQTRCCSSCIKLSCWCKISVCSIQNSVMLDCNCWVSSKRSGSITDGFNLKSEKFWCKAMSCSRFEDLYTSSATLTCLGLIVLEMKPCLSSAIIKPCSSIWVFSSAITWWELRTMEIYPYNHWIWYPYKILLVLKLLFCIRTSKFGLSILLETLSNRYLLTKSCLKYLAPLSACENFPQFCHHYEYGHYERQHTWRGSSILA